MMAVAEYLGWDVSELRPVSFVKWQLIVIVKQTFINQQLFIRIENFVCNTVHSPISIVNFTPTHQYRYTQYSQKVICTHTYLYFVIYVKRCRCKWKSTSVLYKCLDKTVILPCYTQSIQKRLICSIKRPSGNTKPTPIGLRFSIVSFLKYAHYFFQHPLSSFSTISALLFWFVFF